MRALAVVAIIGVIGLLVGFASLIVASRDNARRSVGERLTARADLTGGFIAAAVRDLERREVRAVQSRMVDGRLNDKRFQAVVEELNLPAAVYLDRSGHLVAVYPGRPDLIGTRIADKYAHLAAAVAGRRSASNVVPSAATGQPIIGLATPIGDGANRTVFSGGFNVMDTPVASYVRHALTQAGGETYVIDATGTLVAGSRGTGLTTLRQTAPRLARSLAHSGNGTGTFGTTAGDRFFTSASVSGTPWRIVLSVPTAELYVSAGGPIATAWVVFAGFVFAALGLAILIVVLRRRSRTLASANSQLTIKQAEVYRLLEFEQQFVGRSSHELRTPLTSVIGYLEVLIDSDEPLSETQRGHLDAAHRNSRRLHALVDDLLLLNETETSAVVLAPEAIDPDHLLRPLTYEYEILCAREGLRFEVEMPENIPTILVDRTRTEQVLTNLLGNAVKFTPRGHTVGVRVRVADDAVHMSVWDTGLGIPPGELDQVFDRFYRSSSAEKRKIPGTGLGLPIARALAETQHGTLTVTSQVGVGSVFTLAVPLSGKPAGVA